MRLLLVRHGETEWNVSGHFQGQSDAELTELGRLQARQAAHALSCLNVNALYSSPLPRAVKTAQEIAAKVALEVCLIDGLQEISLGELEGITGPAMRERYPEVSETWRRNPSRVTFPGGESLRQLQARAWRAVQQIERAHPNGVVVAVSHGFAICTIVSRFLGLPLSRFHRIRVDQGSITCMEVEGSTRHLLSFNDRCHLDASPAREG